MTENMIYSSDQLINPDKNLQPVSRGGKLTSRCALGPSALVGAESWSLFPRFKVPHGFLIIWSTGSTTALRSGLARLCRCSLAYFIMCLATRTKSAEFISRRRWCFQSCDLPDSSCSLLHSPVRPATSSTSSRWFVDWINPSLYICFLHYGLLYLCWVITGEIDLRTLLPIWHDRFDNKVLQHKENI